MTCLVRLIKNKAKMVLGWLASPKLLSQVLDVNYFEPWETEAHITFEKNRQYDLDFLL